MRLKIIIIIIKTHEVNEVKNYYYYYYYYQNTQEVKHLLNASSHLFLDLKIIIKIIIIIIIILLLLLLLLLLYPTPQDRQRGHRPTNLTLNYNRAGPASQADSEIRQLSQENSQPQDLKVYTDGSVIKSQSGWGFGLHC